MIRKIIPLCLLLAIGSASATGILNVLLGEGNNLSFDGYIVSQLACLGTTFAYSVPNSCGSASPSEYDSSGHRVIVINYIVSPSTSAIAISGFSSDPGQNYFLELYCNNIPYEASSTATYVYNSGTANWTFTGQTCWNTNNNPPTGYFGYK
ncbi:MAG: hypothetical protein WBR29_03050 [Gammaproteobacteria bacterium]